MPIWPMNSTNYFNYPESNLATLLENVERLSKMGTWEIDFISQSIYWSEGVYRMMGYTPFEFEVTFENGLEIVFPEDRMAAIAHMNEALAGEKEYEIQKRLIKKNGEIIHVISKASVLRNEFGVPEKMIGVFQDISEFIITKEKLKKSKTTTQVLLEKLDGIFWEVDASTLEFKYISPQVEQITGFTREEWMSEPDFWQNHIHPEDRDQAIYYCDLKTSQNLDHSFDYRFIRKDGRIIWLNDRVKVISENGRPKTLSGLMVDVTAEKNLSLALQDEISLKQNLIQHLPSSIFLLDEDQNFLLWNKKFEEWSECDPKEIPQMKPLDFFEEADRPQIQNAIIDLTISKRPVVLECHMKTKSGKRVPLLVSASRVIYKNQECILGVSQNISELVANKRALEESNKRYEILSKATNDAVWDFDVLSNQLVWAEGFNTLFGFDLDLVKPNLDFFIHRIHPEDRGRIFLKIQEFMKPNHPVSNWLEEYRFLKADGVYAFVVDKAAFIRDSEGRVIRVVGAMQDITERKQYETSLTNLNIKLERNVRELAISNMELEQFAFVASHDLQEPLRMISSFLMLLSSKYGDQLDEKAHRYINFARDGAKRMQQIILDLLELSRVGKPNEARVELNINSILEEVEANFKKLITEKQAIIARPILPNIQGYRTPILQIFNNLIGNGLKYSKTGIPPKLTIQVKDADKEWVFSVKDEGIGIEKEYFDKIFVIFQRLHQGEEYPGTGIGLAIVKKAVDFLQGRIWVESEVGQGTVFYFTIPKA